MLSKPSFAEIPLPLMGMLRDEANLSSAQRVLEEAHQECEAREEELRRHRPALGFLASKKQREDYAAAMATVRHQIEAIERMLPRVATARERLQSPLRAALLDYMQDADPAYRQGLRAARFQEHWRRGHALVVDRLTAFLRDLRGAKGALAEDLRTNRTAPSEDTLWHLSNVHTAATHLETEIASFNKAGEAYTQTVAGTPFASVRLPVLEQWPCSGCAEALSTLPLPVASFEIERLLNEFLDLRQPSLDAMSALLQAAGDEHTQLAEARLREYWSELLNYAECHLVSDAELETTLAEIERRQLAVERNRLAAHHPDDPFAAER